jgi:hypothetical protein
MYIYVYIYVYIYMHMYSFNQHLIISMHSVNRIFKTYIYTYLYVIGGNTEGTVEVSMNVFQGDAVELLKNDRDPK